MSEYPKRLNYYRAPKVTREIIAGDAQRGISMAKVTAGDRYQFEVVHDTGHQKISQSFFLEAHAREKFNSLIRDSIL